MDIRDSLYTNDTLVFCSLLWIKGAIFQGNRLLEIYKTRMDEFHKTIADGEWLFNRKDNPNHPWDMDLVEVDFYVSALYKAYKFTKEAATEYEDMKEVVRTLGESVSIDDLKDVRDMMSHGDEYVKPGGGRHSDRYFKRSEDGSCVASAESIHYTEDAFWIGNRVEVLRVQAALNKALLIAEKFNVECSRKRIKSILGNYTEREN